MGKQDVVHIHSRIQLSHKKEGNNAICSNMDGPRDYHISEVSQKEKDKYHVLPLICEIKKKDINELIYKTEIDSPTLENKYMITKWE